MDFDHFGDVIRVHFERGGQLVRLVFLGGLDRMGESDGARDGCCLLEQLEEAVGEARQTVESRVGGGVGREETANMKQVGDASEGEDGDGNKANGCQQQQQLVAAAEHRMCRAAALSRVLGGRRGRILPGPSIWTSELRVEVRGLY